MQSALSGTHSYFVGWAFYFGLQLVSHDLRWVLNQYDSLSVVAGFCKGPATGVYV